MRVTGVTSEVVLVRKASGAALASSREKARSTKANPASRANSITTRRVMPFRITGPAGRVTIAPSPVTIQALLEVPSVTKPSASTCQAS